jgi:hypothetical protein
VSSAVGRVLELFIRPPKQGVTGVTRAFVTPENSLVTPVTAVTYQKQHSPIDGVTGVTATPENHNFAGLEQAAIIEYDGGAPRAWAEALARVDPGNPPADVPPKRWLRFIDDCGRFLDDGWAPSAEALGWGPLDLFGCDCLKPFARINRAGLLWLLNGRKLLVLAADAAAIAGLSGGIIKYRRCLNEPGTVLAWELSRDADVQ